MTSYLPILRRGSSTAASDPLTLGISPVCFLDPNQPIRRPPPHEPIQTGRRAGFVPPQSSPPKNVSLSAWTFSFVFSTDWPERISTVYLPEGRYRLRVERSGSASSSKSF